MNLLKPFKFSSIFIHYYSPAFCRTYIRISQDEKKRPEKLTMIRLKAFHSFFSFSTKNITFWGYQLTIFPVNEQSRLVLVLPEHPSP